MSGPPLSSLPDQELCASLCEGNQAAFGMIYTKYAPVLLGLISGMTQSPLAAEEALKETFLKIWNTAGCYDATKTSLLSWMMGIARESASLSANSDNQPPASAAQPTPGIKKAVSQLNQNYPLLTPSEKEVLDLVYLKGLSCAEAAQQLQLPVKTITTHLRMAISHLKTAQTA